MSYEEIKRLMDDMGEAKIDELEIEFPEGMKVKLKKHANIQKTEEVPISNQTQITLKQEIEKKESPCIIEPTKDNIKIITSPMVGTFYEAASPKQPPIVKVGDMVKKGDVLCIIEAMKLMNEIESEFDGEIVEICVQNEEIVDFGKPLFKIR